VSRRPAPRCATTGTRALADRRVALAAVVGLAVALRLAGLGDRLSDAEGYSWLVASAPGFDAFLDRLAAYENTPPLFYALLAGLPDSDEAWLRLPALIPAVACVPVLYCLVRPLLGTRVALLAALALAVAPFHVSYSNYSRGFMLAALGVLVAAWAVARLAEGRRGRWWWVYMGGAALALHSEYDAVLFLAPLVALPALWRGRGWRTTALLVTLPLSTLLPLVGEMLDGLEQLDVTKLDPPSPGLSVGSLRDSVVALFGGTHGLAGSGLLRFGQLLTLLGALGVSAYWLGRSTAADGSPRASDRRRAGEAVRSGCTTARAAAGAASASATAARVADRPDGHPNRPDGTAAMLSERTSRLPERTGAIAYWLLVVAPAVAVTLHVLASALGPDVFDARYLVALIPFLAALLAYGVCALPWGWAAPAVAAALVAVGALVFVQRHERELQPDFAPAGAAVRAAGARTVLTNTPVAAYYLRDLRPHLDRPFGLGNDEPRCAAECPQPLAIVEDSRLPGGVRAGPGTPVAHGPIVVRIAGP
jgi:Dolichyl-phosphate-mannose-protein mannosyltransferase